MAEVQFVLHPARPRAEGGQAEAVRGEPFSQILARKRFGALRKHFDRVESQFSGGTAAVLEAVVEDERSLPGFRNEADRDGGFHAVTA